MMVDIETLKNKVLSGKDLTEDEAYLLVDIAEQNPDKLWDAASEITAKFCRPVFDSCSILNARSGKCSENCKWCAQSAHFNTNIDTYSLVGHDDCMKAAQLNREHNIHRFSLVTSGRAMKGRDLERACGYYAEIDKEGGLELCASMGLLDEKELEKLYKAGVRRYHCNLETAPSHFKTLCTTHDIKDKLRTIEKARKLGFEICSGGIIGMGETMKQRVEFALTLREIAPNSIPINILQPIPGTPLENTAPLTKEEILTTIAIFRFIHPSTVLRFAGGRAQLSRDTQIQAMRIGINGAIVGDLLTTVGSTVAKDRELVSEVGYTFN